MSFFNQKFISKIERVYYDKTKNIVVDIKREDKIHPYISGNKFRKLKYNILKAKEEKHSCLLTFGGAYSNHIAATASAAKINNLKSIGVIRGEEIEKKFNENPHHNPTLSYAKNQGMEFYFVSRDAYRHKEESDFIEKLKEKFGHFYTIPEGGTNPLAVKGCEEILTTDDEKYDYICCSVGTGGTLAGIINASKQSQEILGFSALKGHEHHEISNFVRKDNFEIIQDKEFGGYAKTNTSIVEFMNDFYKQTTIKLDPIYTGKMMFKIFKMLDNHQFKENSKILAIHTGGIQGVEAFNNLQKNKNRPVLIFQ